MNGWTLPADVHARVQRLWDNGRILAAMAGGEPVFPLRIPLKGPQGQALADAFDAARAWITALQTGAQDHGFTLDFQEVQHRQLGRNRVPVAALLADEDAGLALLGKRRDGKRFRSLVAAAIGEFPQLATWLRARPLQALDAAEEWPRLAGVLRWLQQHPRPGVYLRQLDVPGVDTKFIERRKGLLAELLDLVLPGDAIDPTASGAGAFERRYGFRTKPAQVRFRLLDPALRVQGLDDLAVPAQQFGRLNPAVRTVYVTENEINGLAFPDIPDAMVIFGLGYDVDRLTAASWLQDKDLAYWGDLDTHGFAMLDRLRHHFPQARSLLMHREVLLAHQSQWVSEATPTRRDLPRLLGDEAALYDDLRADRIGKAVRLEQERIGFGWLLAALGAASSG